VIYRSDYPFDIYQRGNQNGKSHDRQYNDQQEKLEDIKGVIRTVNHMTGNTMTNKKSLKISKG
jgi:5-methylcytosine-specific restriction endonuclease McrBC regulatory subunit McrC